MYTHIYVYVHTYVYMYLYIYIHIFIFMYILFLGHSVPSRPPKKLNLLSLDVFRETAA